MREDTYTSARIINVILGIWLVISAFVWPHTYAQTTNTWIVGALVVAFSLVAMRVPEVRYLNTVLAVWLFISVWALPTMTMGTTWNNAIVAIAVFFVSLAPAYLETRGRTLPRP